ncbi:MAG: hypothetical protein JXR63_13865 [Spirochaetales bacterium]|nr:hypothetical protein [Spirochaetales bacterium]
MKNHKRLRVLFYVLIVFIIFMIVIFSIMIAVLKIDFVIGVKIDHSADTKPVQWDNSLNLRQGYNQCSAFSASAFIYSTSGEFHEPRTVYETFSKMDNGMVTPFEIVKYLRKSGYSVKLRYLGLMGEDRQKRYLIDSAKSNNPYIALVLDHGVLHYITVLGFSDGFFHVYDSMQSPSTAGFTIDENGFSPGNKDFSLDEFYEIWSGPAYKRIYLRVIIQ